MEAQYSPQILEAYEQFVGHFAGDRVIKSTTECDVCCPVHEDRHPSLGIDLRTNGRGPEILLHCRSQKCDRKDILGAVGLTDEDRFLEKDQEQGALPGCTVAQYATYKKLPEEFLRGDTVGLEDSEYWCRVTKRTIPAVRIPYTTQTGEELPQCARYRTGLKKTTPDTRIRAIPKSQGGELTLYGRHGLEDFRKVGYVYVVEGESDCHTLWYYEEPAVGVPGVQNWRSEWADLFEGIPKIFVFIEDEAGEKLWKALRSCSTLEGRLRRVVF